jgi:hypothetical protein
VQAYRLRTISTFFACDIAYPSSTAAFSPSS